MAIRESVEHRVKLRRDISEERAPRHGAQLKGCGVTRCAHLSSLRQLQRIVLRRAMAVAQVPLFGGGVIRTRLFDLSASSTICSGFRSSGESKMSIMVSQPVACSKQRMYQC